MPIRTASRENMISKTTLQPKFYGEYPVECEAGAPATRIIEKAQEGFQ